MPLVTVQGLAYLAVAGAGVTGLFLTRRPRLPIDIVLIFCAVLLPWIAQRHLPLTVLIVLIIGGEHIASAAPLVVRRLTAGASTAPDWAADNDTAADIVADTVPQERQRSLSSARRGGVARRNVCAARDDCHFTANGPHRLQVRGVSRRGGGAARGFRGGGWRCERRGAFQLGRIRAVARRAAREGVDGRPARDGILGRRVSRQHAVHRRRR